MFLLWHPSLTAINVSYTFPILETSATALCGTTGTCLVGITVWLLSHLSNMAAQRRDCLQREVRMITGVKDFRATIHSKITIHHQHVQVWVYPYISLTYSLYRWGFLHFTYLKCLVITWKMGHEWRRFRGHSVSEFWVTFQTYMEFFVVWIVRFWWLDFC